MGSFVLSLKLGASAAEDVRWKKCKSYKHLLHLCPLDEAQWGGPVHQDLSFRQPKAIKEGTDINGLEDTSTRPPQRKRRRLDLKALTLAFEVSAEQVENKLPTPFERKKYTMARARPRAVRRA